MVVRTVRVVVGRRVVDRRVVLVVVVVVGRVVEDDDPVVALVVLDMEEEEEVEEEVEEEEEEVEEEREEVEVGGFEVVVELGAADFVADVVDVGRAVVVVVIVVVGAIVVVALVVVVVVVVAAAVVGGRVVEVVEALAAVVDVDVDVDVGAIVPVVVVVVVVVFVVVVVVVVAAADFVVVVDTRGGVEVVVWTVGMEMAGIPGHSVAHVLGFVMSPSTHALHGKQKLPKSVVEQKNGSVTPSWTRGSQSAVTRHGTIGAVGTGLVVGTTRSGQTCAQGPASGANGPMSRQTLHDMH